MSQVTEDKLSKNLKALYIKAGMEMSILGDSVSNLRSKSGSNTLLFISVIAGGFWGAYAGVPEISDKIKYFVGVSTCLFGVTLSVPIWKAVKQTKDSLKQVSSTIIKINEIENFEDEQNLKGLKKSLSQANKKITKSACLTVFCDVAKAICFTPAVAKMAVIIPQISWGEPTSPMQTFVSAVIGAGILVVGNRLANRCHNRTVEHTNSMIKFYNEAYQQAHEFK